MLQSTAILLSIPVAGLWAYGNAPAHAEENTAAGLSKYEPMEALKDKVGEGNKNRLCCEGFAQPRYLMYGCSLQDYGKPRMKYGDFTTTPSGLQVSASWLHQSLSITVCAACTC
jgi:hypothetical protein